MAAAICSGKPCCSDCSSGTAYADCSCLPDNVVTRGHVVEAQGYGKFHYRLTNWRLADAEDRSLKIRFEPCYGDGIVLLDTVPQTFPTNATARWRGPSTGPTTVQIDLDYEQYFVSIFALERTNFTLAAFTNGTAFTVGGRNVTVQSPPATLILEGETLDMQVSFQSLADPGTEYRVFSARRDAGACAVSGNPNECILTTACGVEHAMTPSTEWFTLPATTAGQVHTVTVSGLSQDVPYAFSVIARDSDGNTAVFRTTDGTPTYERTETAMSMDVVWTVVGVVIGVLILLVLSIFVCRMRLRKAYRVKRA